MKTKNPSTSSKKFKPQDYQIPYNIRQRIHQGIPKGESIEFDVLFVGAGPSALAGALRLKQKDPNIQIGMIEKASRLGGHSLSGAVVDPAPFKKLFPDTNISDFPFRLQVQKEKMYFLTKKRKFRIPLPPTMKNQAFYTASLCEIVRWLGSKAEDLGINIFPSTAAQKLIVQNDRVVGVQTTATGLDKNQNQTSQYQDPINIMAKTIFLCDGVRGNLSQAYLKWKKISSKYPEHYALGIKEVWKVLKPPEEILHTVGWPLKNFGGSFLYPLSKDLICIGLVGSLDTRDGYLDMHKKFQMMKEHPFFKKILKKGQCLEWGAKAIPEGGFHSIPNQISEDHLFILGDAAGLVNVPSLKGIHYAMFSGILAAEYFLDKKSSTKNSFDHLLKNHPLVGKDLYKVRNVIQTLQAGIFYGWIQAALMILTRGLFPGDLNPQKLKSDQEVVRNKFLKTKIDSLTSKQDSVYLSGNKTRDDIPIHLDLPQNELPDEVKNFYSHFCPAGVYEVKNSKLVVNHPNCVDCKATDILGPWWNPREGGSGPDYNLM